MAKLIQSDPTPTMAVRDWPELEYLSGGLNVADSPHKLKPIETPDTSNMEFRQAEVWKRPGFTQLGGQLTGTPKALCDYEDASGARYFVCITTTKVYRYNAVGDAWVDITGSGVSLTADEDDFVSWVVTQDSTGENILVFTNGVDAPKKWSPNQHNGEIDNLGGLGAVSLTQAKGVTSFRNHLLLFNTTEGGAINPQRIRWSTAGNPETWTGGSSGFTILIDDVSPVYAILPLSRAAYVYKARSVNVLTPTGDISNAFQPDIIIPGTGILSFGAAVPLDEYHIVTTLRATSLFNGAPNLDDMNVSRKVEAVMHNAYNRNRAHRGMTLAVRDHPKFYSFFPTNLDWATTAFVFELAYNRWNRWDFSGMEISAIGTYRRSESLTWADVQQLGWTWKSVQAQDRPWVQAELSAQAPLIAIATKSGYVYKRDLNVVNDAGSSINAHIDTKDFAYLDAKVRALKISFEAIGDSVDISYSVDAGQSWTSIQSVVLADEWATYDVPVDAFGKRMRFRFANGNTNETFGLRGMYVELVKRTNR